MSHRFVRIAFFGVSAGVSISLATAACTVSATTGPENAAGSEGGTPGNDAGGGSMAIDVPPGREAGAGSDSGERPDTGAAPFVQAPHPAWPVVTAFPPGRVLKPLKLVSIVVQGDPLSSALFGFGDALVSGTWWKAVTPDYGLGTASSPTVHVTGPAIPDSATHADPKNPDGPEMSQYILSLIAAHTAPAPDDNTMYMLYLPPGVVAFDDATGTSNTMCQLYGGYHDVLDPSATQDGGAGGVAWGFAQRCPGTAMPSDQDTLTVAASHEILEATTDPVPGYGWGLAGPDPELELTTPWVQLPDVALGGEVGDLCAGSQWSDGTYAYQRIWSTTAAMGAGDPCVPAYPDVPYVNVSAAPSPDAAQAGLAAGWYAVTAGSSVTIPLTGFSDRPAADWFVYPSPGATNDTAAQLTTAITSPSIVQTNAGPTATVHNGGTATLTVTAAPGTPSGTWTTVQVISQPEQSIGGDPAHYWPVGVYVP